MISTRKSLLVSLPTQLTIQLWVPTLTDLLCLKFATMHCKHLQLVITSISHFQNSSMQVNILVDLIKLYVYINVCFDQIFLIIKFHIRHCTNSTLIVHFLVKCEKCKMSSWICMEYYAHLQTVCQLILSNNAHSETSSAHQIYRRIGHKLFKKPFIIKAFCLWNQVSGCSWSKG